MRVLVTGSRDWNADAAVYVALENAWVRYGPFTLTHGACQDKDGNLLGADRYASEWADWKPGVTNDPHPADWLKHGRPAGPIRNREMVELLEPGQDIVLAFQRQHSRGTQHTIDLAKARGLEISIWRAD